MNKPLPSFCIVCYVVFITTGEHTCNRGRLKENTFAKFGVKILHNGGTLIL